MKCPETLGQLGSSVVLPLTPAGKSRGRNESIRIIVAKDSPGSNVKSKIVTLDFPRDDAPRYLESGYKFHLGTLSLEVLQGRRKDEGSYTMTLEENVSVEHFCRQLRLYGKDGRGFPAHSAGPAGSPSRSRPRSPSPPPPRAAAPADRQLS